MTPPGVTSFSWDDASAAFTSGLTAIGMNYHTEVLTLTCKARSPTRWSQASRPRPHFGTWMLSVNKASQNKEWAYRAANWFTSGPTQTKMLAAQFHPSRKSVYEAAKTDENAPSSGTSTTSWANRSRSALAAPG